MDYHRKGYPLGKYRDDNPEIQQKGPSSVKKERNYHWNVPVICRGIAKRKKTKELKSTNAIKEGSH